MQAMTDGQGREAVVLEQETQSGRYVQATSHARIHARSVHLCKCSRFVFMSIWRRPHMCPTITASNMLTFIVVPMLHCVQSAAGLRELIIQYTLVLTKRVQIKCATHQEMNSLLYHVLGLTIHETTKMDRSLHYECVGHHHHRKSPHWFPSLLSSRQKIVRPLVVSLVLNSTTSRSSPS